MTQALSDRRLLRGGQIKQQGKGSSRDFRLAQTAYPHGRPVGKYDSTVAIGGDGETVEMIDQGCRNSAWAGMQKMRLRRFILGG